MSNTPGRSVRSFRDQSVDSPLWYKLLPQDAYLEKGTRPQQGLMPVQSSLDEIDRAKILAVAKSEIHKHRWDSFLDRLPSANQDGEDFVVRGCTACRKQLNKVSEFVDHLYEVVLPRIIASSK